MGVLSLIELLVLGPFSHLPSEFFPFSREPLFEDFALPLGDLANLGVISNRCRRQGGGQRLNSSGQVSHKLFSDVGILLCPRMSWSWASVADSVSALRA